MLKSNADMAGESRPMKMARKTIPLPDLKPGDVVLEIAGCGVCGTDLSFFYGEAPTTTRPPVTLGHEMSGVVIAGDEEWLGKEVIVPTIFPCRNCTLCSSGRANRCLSQKMPGNSYGIYGGFSSHIVVKAKELCEVKNRGSMPLAHLAVAADAVATPFQAAKRADLRAGDRVVIIGATGGLGTYMAQWAKYFKAEAVVGIGQNPHKLERSMSHGINFTINASKKSPWDVRKEFWSLCKRNGLDPKYGWKIFEMSGARLGRQIGLELIGYAGMLVLVGYGTEVLSYNFSKLMAFDAEIHGSWGCLPEYYPFITRTVLEGAVQITPFVETRPMSSIVDTFEEIHQKGSPTKRIVLVPDF
jgi:6-hydroxycyclohex-1-ene-1-carbonyl-CoA dehydrogenase